MRNLRTTAVGGRNASGRGRAMGVMASAIAALTVLTACSGDDSSDSSATANLNCESTTPVTIMMGTSDMDISYSPYALLANQLGYFAEECIDATVTTTGGQTTTQQALLGNAADIAIQTPDSLVIAAGKERLPISVFYNLIPRSTYELVTMSDDITTDADLKGKTIGVPVVTDSLTAYVTARLQDVNLSADSVQIIATGYGGTSMEALKSGQIDAFVGWPGLWAAYNNSGYEFEVLPEPDWQYDYYGMGLGALDSYIEENPEIIEGVSRALAKSSVFLAENTDAAIDLFWDEFPARAPLPGQDKEQARKNDMAVLESTTSMMGIGTLSPDHMWGEQTADKWGAQIAYNKDAGLITQDLDPNLFFTNEFNAAANEFDRQAIVDQAAGE